MSVIKKIHTKWCGSFYGGARDFAGYLTVLTILKEEIPYIQAHYDFTSAMILRIRSSPIAVS